jgi:hypothetical protein
VGELHLAVEVRPPVRQVERARRVEDERPCDGRDVAPDELEADGRRAGSLRTGERGVLAVSTAEVDRVEEPRMERPGGGGGLRDGQGREERREQREPANAPPASGSRRCRTRG